MDSTPKKLLNSNTNCFICSDEVTSKQRQSGSKGTSSVDLHRLLNKALDIDLNVYSNSDIAVCIKCYKSLVKYQKAEENVQDIKTELKSTYSAMGHVKRLQWNEDELMPGTSPVKKHLLFVNENPTNCSSSNLTSLRLPLPRLAPSPINKP